MSWCHNQHNFGINKQQLVYEGVIVIFDERLLQPANLKDRIKNVLEVPLFIIRPGLRSTCLRIWKQYIKLSSTLINAPALSKSLQ